jgi:hypothetical protein
LNTGIDTNEDVDERHQWHKSKWHKNLGYSKQRFRGNYDNNEIENNGKFEEVIEERHEEKENSEKKENFEKYVSEKNETKKTRIASTENEIIDLSQNEWTFDDLDLWLL